MNEDLLDDAWGLIANAGGGEWTNESEEWQDAAVRWRDRYHVTLGDRPSPLLEAQLADGERD